MSAYILFGCAGYLLGSLLVNIPADVFWPGVLLSLAGSLIGWGVTQESRVFRSTIFFVGALIGYMLVQESVKQEMLLASEILFDGEVLVLSREEVKPWYVPLRVRPYDAELSTDILFHAQRTLTVKPGERMHLQCTLKRPENFDEHFDYVRYLWMQGIGYICERGQVRGESLPASGWRTYLFEWQSILRGAIARVLPDPAAGLLQGLLLGGDDALPQSVSESFRRAGLSHVVAVSGYNMTVVASFFLMTALLLGFWRKTAVIVAIFGVGLFLFLIDTSAASFRAALMTGMVALAYLVGRPNQMFLSLLMAGTSMACIQPLLVRYDVGFQLSFMATLALVVIIPWVDVLTKKSSMVWRLLVIPLTTLAISFFVDPVAAFHFGTVSLISPVTNTIVLPLIPFAMALGFVLLLISWCIPFLVPILLFPTWLVLMGIIWTASWGGSLAWATLENTFVNEWFLLGSALVFSGVVWYSRKSFYAYVLRMDRTDYHR